MTRNAAWLDAQDDKVARAAITRAGASLGRPTMNGDLAPAQVTQHSASSPEVSVSEAYTSQGGGAHPTAHDGYDYDLPEGGSWRKDAYGIPYWTPESGRSDIPVQS